MVKNALLNLQSNVYLFGVKPGKSNNCHTSVRIRSKAAILAASRYALTTASKQHLEADAYHGSDKRISICPLFSPPKRQWFCSKFDSSPIGAHYKGEGDVCNPFGSHTHACKQGVM